VSKSRKKHKGGIKGYLERLPPIPFKRLAIKLIPYIGIFYVGDKLAWLYRYCAGQTAFSRLFVLLSNVQLAFQKPVFSFYPSDMLTGLGNRNAYEERRKALSDRKTRPALSCIVADVTGLKLINDAHGHSAGDTALIETAEAIRKVLPEGGECFRTGGDEFIILIESSDFGVLNTVVDNLQAEVAERARTRTLPLLLAIGKGVYKLYDDNVTDFIRRVDSLMYADKYIQKQKLREQGFKIRD